MESPLHQIASSLPTNNNVPTVSSLLPSIPVDQPYSSSSVPDVVVGVSSSSTVSYMNNSSSSSTTPPSPPTRTTTTTTVTTDESTTTIIPTVGSSPYDWTKVYQQWDQDEDTWDDTKLDRKNGSTSTSSSAAVLSWETLLASSSSSASNHNPLSMTCSHDHSAEQRIFNMSHGEKVATCTYLKQLGNLYTLEGQYPYAIDRYHRGLIYYEYSFPDNDQEQKEIDNIQLQLLLNNSLAELRLHNYDKVINLTSQALGMDSTNIKAYYRRAIAFRCIHDYEKAHTDIKQALNILREQLTAIEGSSSGTVPETKNTLSTIPDEETVLLLSRNRSRTTGLIKLRTILYNELTILKRYQNYYKHQEQRMARYIVQELQRPTDDNNNNDDDDKNGSKEGKQSNAKIPVHSINGGTNSSNLSMNNDNKDDDNHAVDEEDDEEDNHSSYQELLHYPTPSITSQLLQL